VAEEIISSAVAESKTCLIAKGGFRLRATSSDLDERQPRPVLRSYCRAGANVCGR
jgi:hypothetical protein